MIIFTVKALKRIYDYREESLIEYKEYMMREYQKGGDNHAKRMLEVIGLWI